MAEPKTITLSLIVCWNLLRPLLFTLPPETAHHLAFQIMGGAQALPWLRKVISRACTNHDNRLKISVFGLDFQNPVGLAAGFDKDAQLLPIWHALGFGFTEVGTITPLAQEGNPRPRLFRLPSDKALINRMGFNNDGAEIIRQRLLTLLNSGNWPIFPVGINLGKGRQTPIEKALEDYSILLDQFLDLGDYFVVNISSPNTPGLRQLQEKPRLNELLGALQQKNRDRYKANPRPLLLKASPDLEWQALDDVLELCVKHQLAGIIATNTTLSRDGIQTSIDQEGGLSGRPLKNQSTEFIRYIYRSTKGKLPIIGVGGIFTAEDAYEKICSGASLVQVYTGFVYQGPCLVKQINQGLIRLLKKDGFRLISEAIGKDIN